MCDMFGLNFVGPSYNIIKYENKKGMQFVTGKQHELFRLVVEIYKQVVL
jgi:hypothetical protein